MIALADSRKPEKASNSFLQGEPSVCLVNRAEENAVVCKRVDIADSVPKKTLGLLGRAKLETNECLIIPQCSSIHTHFMRFPIDIVFLDETWVVVRVVHGLAPWKWAFDRGAAHVIEMQAGHAEQCGIHEGTQLGLAVRKPKYNRKKPQEEFSVGRR